MKRGQAERLIPLLEEVLAAEKIGWQDLELIAVGIGPGNFTGIRISVSAARGMGLALGIPVMGVSMFELMLQRMGAWAAPSIVTSVPAPREQVYTQHFRYGIATAAPEILDLANLPADLQYPINTRVVGFAAETLCHAGHASNWEDKEVSNVAERIGYRADARWLAGETTPSRPAPLYVKAADAAPARDAPPVIIP